METIKQNRDFQRIFTKGKSAASETVVVYACRSRYEGKAAFIAGKKVGIAVRRNRAKRLLRAAFQQITKEYEIKAKTDFIFVSRSATPGHKMQDVYADMALCLKKIGMI